MSLRRTPITADLVGMWRMPAPTSLQLASVEYPAIASVREVQRA
jgi:hypothetical protein